ncbi:hypothetical protein FDUTEX481_01417 [Tolypothrix sp. PCC 7601]|nr:hypothetical protein FDUTEX481_01417 [Tolypothrix sp. PCC 7601]
MTNAVDLRSPTLNRLNILFAFRCFYVFTLRYSKILVNNIFFKSTFYSNITIKNYQELILAVKT